MKFDSNFYPYGYMRMTHIVALLWGLPITRRKIKGCKRNKHSDVQGHRYTYGASGMAIWLAHAALEAYVLHMNYRLVKRYVGESFKKCFEESYCFAVIELFNRNVGPFSALVCFAFCARRHKVAALAGTERVLAFIRSTDVAAGVHLSPAVRYYSPVVLTAYVANVGLYAFVQHPAITFMYVVNALGQTAVANLTVFQYYVLERGYARVNRLLETAAGARGGPGSVARALHRLADTYDHLGRLVEHVNRAYAFGLSVRWLYTVVRLVMVVFRIFEYYNSARAGRPFSRGVIALSVEHVFELLLSVQHITFFCATGSRLSDQANRTLGSLQKLKLRHRFHPDMDFRKTVDIFLIQVNARRVRATTGGLIIINMDLMKTIFVSITTYLMVLVQFQFQKSTFRPLYQHS